MFTTYKAFKASIRAILNVNMFYDQGRVFVRRWKHCDDFLRSCQTKIVNYKFHYTCNVLEKCFSSSSCWTEKHLCFTIKTDLKKKKREICYYYFSFTTNESKAQLLFFIAARANSVFAWQALWLAPAHYFSQNRLHPKRGDWQTKRPVLKNIVPISQDNCEPRSVLLSTSDQEINFI